MKKPFERLLRSASFNIIFVSAISLLTILLINRFSFFRLTELKSLDFRLTHFARSDMADTNIIIAAIDQNSLDFFEKQEVSWPWPREFYSSMVDYLSECGAKAVIFDIDFSSSEIERNDVDPQISEQAFAGSLKAAGNCIIGVSLKNIEKGDQPGNPILRKHRLSPFDYKNLPLFNSASAPLASFQEGAKMLGSVNVFPDEDGIIRRVPLLFRVNDFFVPQLGFGSWTMISGKSANEVKNAIETIPTDKNGRYLIKWYGSGGPGGVYKYYSIHSIIVSGYKAKQNVNPDVAPELFRNKIVLVGGSAVGLMDYKPVPFSSEAGFPGMEIHANIINNLIKNDFVYSVPGYFGWIAALIFIILVPVIFFKVRGIALTVSLIIFLGVAYFSASIFLFTFNSTIIPVVLPIASVIISLIFSAIVSYELEGRRKRELKKIFSRYLSPKIVDELAENPEYLELGGKEVEATVYFSDIKNFTSISERMQPKDLVKYLNEYFAVCTNIILKHEAMLDKYIGDAVMAVFGIPVEKPLHPVEACYAALEVQRALKQKNSFGNGPDFQTRIGINTGKMIVGNIGTELHLDFTVIGDTVNLSSRLEGVNKVFGTSIIISEYTYNLAKDYIEVRELDDLTVKGKEIPVRIYELISEKGKITKAHADMVKLFNEGLMFYRAREWDKAIICFNNVLSTYPEDKASQVYIQRCNLLAKETLPDNWRGVFNLQEK